MPEIILQKEKVDSRCEIHDVRADFVEDGKEAVLSWKWPDSAEYDYCLIYAPTQEFLEDHTEEELLQNYKPEILNRMTPREYKVPLERVGKRCVLFPARYDKERGAYLLCRQEKGNRSELLQIRPVLRISVAYKDVARGLFGLGNVKEQRVMIRISGTEPLPGSRLVYHCKGRGRDNLRFGIELSEFWGKPMEILVQKGEKLDFEENKRDGFRIEVRESR